MQTHTHTHIKQAASVGSARCWRHIRFMVESWRPAGSSSVTQTDSSGSSTSQAPLLLAHCCCKNLLHIHYRRRTPTASTHCLKGHTCIFGKITSLVQRPSVKMWKCWFHASSEELMLCHSLRLQHVEWKLHRMEKKNPLALKTGQTHASVFIIWKK